jgi:hypothetical protein
MGKGSKLQRRKRKERRNGAFSIFVKNKWNGVEPYADFMRREFVAWNNLPAAFKGFTKKQVVNGGK